MADRARFSASKLWQVQRDYFARRGIDAWRLAEVPCYATTNRVIAGTYAEAVFALHEDRAARGSAESAIVVFELGGGSGRFAFHFLQRLHELCRSAEVPTDRFKYVLTDQAESNLDYWQIHPQLQPFIERRELDVAAFDVVDDDHLGLRVSGEVFGAGSLHEPIVVIANYVFDTVPQDLFFIEAGRARLCEVSCGFGDGPEPADPAEWLQRVEVTYHHADASAQEYVEEWLQVLLDDYVQILDQRYLTLPAAMLRCLDRVSRWSETGLLLLTADYGDHRLSDLAQRPAPALSRHGSFSIGVNYHAVKSFCEARGGAAFSPQSLRDNIDVSAYLIAAGAANYHRTTRTLANALGEFSPDDYLTVVRALRHGTEQMDVRGILAALRLGRYDAGQLAHFLPRLRSLSNEFTADERSAVLAAIARTWAGHFAIGEKYDLALAIAATLYVMEEKQLAEWFVRRSLLIYGPASAALPFFHSASENGAAPDDAPARLARSRKRASNSARSASPGRRAASANTG